MADRFGIASGQQIVDSHFLRNDIGILISTPATSSSSGILIDHNTFIDNGSAGIHLDLIFTAGVGVRDNVFAKNGFRPRLRPRVAGGTVEPNDGISAYGLMTGVSPNPLIFSGLTGVRVHR